MLALDGGGTRGIITIAFLEKMEATLQAKLSRGDDFVLADYFDMIGGTSVGSMLATMLALGWRMERVRKTFEGWVPKLFGRRLPGLNYDARTLVGILRGELGNAPMASERLKTGLAIVAKRADTNSVWVMTNNPASRYWEAKGATLDNGDYLIRDVIRASTAAPTFYSPAEIEIHAWRQNGEEIVEHGRFIDGAVSPHNNPALQLYMLASLPGYNLGGAPIKALRQSRDNGKTWRLGPENLLIVSVGTGSFGIEVKPSRLPRMEAVYSLSSIIGDCEQLALCLMQGLSRPPCDVAGKPRPRWHIDAEIGPMSGDLIASEPQMTFQRYDLRLDEKWLNSEQPGVGPGALLRNAIDRARVKVPRDLPKLQKLINLAAISKLDMLGKAAAEEQVLATDFPDAFDDIWQPQASQTSAQAAQ